MSQVEDHSRVAFRMLWFQIIQMEWGTFGPQASTLVNFDQHMHNFILITQSNHYLYDSYNFKSFFIHQHKQLPNFLAPIQPLNIPCKDVHQG